jgi:1,4-alpha-glucan branching enzyme
MLTLDRRAVRCRIEALAPDLIHAHGQAAAYPFAAFDTGRPSLVTVHGINMLEARVDRRGGALKGGLRVALWAWAEKRCLGRASDVVVISPFVEEVIAPYTTARLHAVNNPVHDDFFALDPEPRPGQVLLVGSIQRRKGILEAIETMSRVRRQVPQARLYVAGGFSPAYEDYGRIVRDRVAEAGAEDYVHFVGNLSHQALCDAYRTSQVFLFPSYLEASSVAVAEAMAAGLPSVVTDIGGTQHLVDHGREGYRVPVGDVDGLARWLVHLLEDGPAARRMGQVARDRARASASAAAVARRTHDLYLQLGSDGP